MTKFQEFAALHHGQLPFVLPNAWDVASALLLQEAGFAAVATTSLGVNAAAGLPDAGGTGRDAAVELGCMLARRLRVPVTVDLEGGYSDDPAAVAALAAELAEAGVAGINLEDGLPGGALRPAGQHVAVIAAVVAAVPGLFVNARTDTYWLKTPAPAERLGETLRRVEAFRDAGRRSRHRQCRPARSPTPRSSGCSRHRPSRRSGDPPAMIPKDLAPPVTRILRAMTPRAPVK